MQYQKWISCHIVTQTAEFQLQDRSTKRERVEKWEERLLGISSLMSMEPFTDRKCLPPTYHCSMVKLAEPQLILPLGTYLDLQGVPLGQEHLF
jgi:hypothetical protein